MTKTCKTCWRPKPVTEFTVNYTRKNRYNQLKTYYKPDCKPCTAALARWNRKMDKKAWV